MSDAGTQEKRQFSLEEKLETTYDRLKITSIFFCIGWFVFVFFFIGINYTSAKIIAMPFAFLGWAIIGGPMIARMWFGGLKNAFNLPEYEVVTTYKDGTKTSDGGLESQATNLVVQIIGVIIMVIVGVALTIIYMVYLTAKYLILYSRVKAKPAFLQGGLFIIVLNIAVFIAAIFLGAGIQNAAIAKMDKAYAEATLPIAEFRSMLEETQKAMFADSFTYSFRYQYDWNRGPLENHSDAANAEADIEVVYDKADDTTVITIRQLSFNNYLDAYEKGVALYLPGRFTFKGNNFTSYFDSSQYIYNDVDINPSNAEIAKVTELLPVNYIFNRLRNANDEDLYSQSTADSDQAELEAEGIIRIYVNKNTHKIFAGVTSGGRNINFSY
jgi:hypothetical protein